MAEEAVITKYDLIIVGGGMAGLHVAIEALREAPKLRLALYEQYEGVGGRCWTFKKEVNGHPVQWEAGAGRISRSHKRVLGLMQRYKLRFIPISPELQYKDDYSTPLEPNAFEPLIPAVIEPLAGLPAEDLSNHTIKQLLTRIRGEAFTRSLLERFPYRVEVETMRADVAIEAFRREMGSQEGYGICAEGFSAIARGMRREIERRKGAICPEHQLIGFKKEAGGYELEFRQGPLKEGVGRPTIKAACERIVLAIPSAALETIVAPKPFRKWLPLKYLKMTPLLRFYGVFPDAWWKAENATDGTKLVTATPIRYFIPGSDKAGAATCHMSYTDSRDAEPWLEKLEARGERAVGEEMVLELRKLLLATIPGPLFVKAHAWRDAVTNWLPGPYDPAELSRQALQPFPEEMPGVHLCGESYSLRQGWVEGALEHAEELLEGGPLGRWLKRMAKKL
jgi:monoamine oxidase